MRTRWMLSLVLTLALCTVVGARAQTPLADSVRAELWKTSFVEAIREDFGRFDAALTHAVAPNERWLRRLRATARPDSVRPYYPNLSLQEVYLDRIGNARRWRPVAERTRRFLEIPQLADTLAGHAYAVLRNPQLTIVAEREWRQELTRWIRAGVIPDPNGTLGAIAREVTVADPAAAALRDQLVAAYTAAEVPTPPQQQFGAVQQALRARHTNADALGAGAIEAIAAQQAAIERMTRAAAALPAGKARDEAEARRDSALFFTRAQARMAGSVIRLVDPEIGRAVETIGVAACDAAEAIRALQGATALNAATAMATGNLLGAGFQVAQLFMKSKADPGALRHAQIMRVLAQIGQQLREIKQQLNIMDGKLDQVIDRMAQLEDISTAQTAALAEALRETEGRLSRQVAGARIDQRELYTGNFVAALNLCRTQVFPEHAPAPSPAIAGRLGECTEGYLDYALNRGTTSAFIRRNADWRGLPGTINDSAAVNYIGIIPEITRELATVSGTRFPDYTRIGAPSTTHPGVVAAATRALIELGVRQPDFRRNDEVAELRTLREHLQAYRAWADSALARSRADDGGGLAAFEAAKAAVTAAILEEETRYLAREHPSQGKPMFALHCAMQLQTSAPDQLARCLGSPPRLTDRLRGRGARELTRYPVFYGNFTLAYTSSYSPEMTLAHKREPCEHSDHQGDHRGGPNAMLSAVRFFDCGDYYTADGTYTITRVNLLSRALPGDAARQQVLLRFRPLQTAATVRTGWHGRPGHAHMHAQNALNAAVVAFVPASHQLVPDSAAGWLANADSALAQTDAILAPERQAFARYLRAQLVNGRAPALAAALTRRDQVATAWRLFERLALGQCFESTSSYVFVAAWQPHHAGDRASLTTLLDEGRLHEVMAALDPISAEVRQALPLRQSKSGVCSRIPPDIDAAIDALDRYQAIRAAAPAQ